TSPTSTSRSRTRCGTSTCLGRAGGNTPPRGGGAPPMAGGLGEKLNLRTGGGDSHGALNLRGQGRLAACPGDDERERRLEALLAPLAHRPLHASRHSR